MAITTGVRVGVGMLTGVRVGEGKGVLVAVGNGVRVGDGKGVRVAVGKGVLVLVRTSICVGVASTAGTAGVTGEATGAGVGTASSSPPHAAPMTSIALTRPGMSVCDSRTLLHQIGRACPPFLGASYARHGEAPDGVGVAVGGRGAPL